MIVAYSYHCHLVEHPLCVLVVVAFPNPLARKEHPLLTLRLFADVKWVLYPLKMLTIAFHEFGQCVNGMQSRLTLSCEADIRNNSAATGCCTGAKIKSITLDPREGGATMMAGGICE